MNHQPTPTTPAGPLLWVDDAYDRAHASDGQSRYSAYLHGRARLFHTEDNPSIDPSGPSIDPAGPTTDPGEFAQLALTVALAPVMSPGYVRTHPRVCHTGWDWDDEGRPAVTLALVAPLPAGLTAVLDRRWWRGWQTRGHGARRVWVAPTENDRPAAYAALTLRIPIDTGELPEPFYRPDSVPDTGRAKAAVRAVCAQVNAHAAAVLAALEQDTPR
jgi:hypothetical protein